MGKAAKTKKIIAADSSDDSNINFDSLNLEDGEFLNTDEEKDEEISEDYENPEDDDEEISKDDAIPKDNDAEIDELHKEYSNLCNQHQDILENLKRQRDEDVVKGQAVKNQKALWDKSLEFRFLLQKVFSSSNKLPQEPTRTSFCKSGEEIDKAYSELELSCKQTLKSMFELQEAILERNPSIVQDENGPTPDIEEMEDDEWMQIHRKNSRLVPFRNSAVDKWQRKTQVTSGAVAFKGKLHAFNQNISEQVSGHMRDPSKMINRMQLRRSSLDTFGKATEESESIKEEIKTENGGVDSDPELVDDSEFYQQLLKEFLESCNLTSTEDTFYALKRMQPKKRKVVDRRASKSRKIRYHVHDKIVNFMAPVAMPQAAVAPKLFENLFGMGKTGKTTSVA